MNREDVLNSALKLEKDGRDFYLEIAAAAPNEYAKKTFESFAEDESNHVGWIKEMSEKGASFVHADPKEVGLIYGKLQSIFACIPEAKKNELASAEDDISQIDIAIGKEEESIQAYGAWAEEADDEEVKKLFETLVDFEKNHRVLLDNVKTYLDKTGDWFMIEEQWGFDGG